MQRRFLTCLLAGVLSGLLAGCAHHYIITLKNGSQIATSSKPRLEGGNYVFKDASGQQVYLPAGRVIEIAPASMAKTPGEMFKPSTSK